MSSYIEKFKNRLSEDRKFSASVEDMLDIIEEYFDEIENNKWISVSDQLPDDDTVVLAVGDGTKASYCKYINGEFERFIDVCNLDRFAVIQYINITHWLPIPKINTEVHTKCTRCNGTGCDPENFETCHLQGDVYPTACQECMGTGDGNHVSSGIL